MLRFIDTLIENLDTTGVKLLYTDTDSFFLALTRPLNDLVYQHKRTDWDNITYKNWFVRDENDTDQIREPGLFKNEAVVTNGSFVALSSKCYSLENYSTNESKQATKGIRQNESIRHELFLENLYENTDIYASQTRMNFDKKQGSMAVIQQRKRALNNLFTKLKVHDDMITITPLQKDGKFI